MADSTVISVKGLSVYYEDFQAVKDVDMDIKR